MIPNTRQFRGIASATSKGAVLAILLFISGAATDRSGATTVTTSSLTDWLGERDPRQWMDALEGLQRETIDSEALDEALREGLAALLADRLSEAIAQMRAYLARNPRSPVAEEILGMALSRQGDLAGGEEHFRKAIALDPKRSSAVTKLGDVLLSRGDLESAKGEFLQAITLNPDDRWAHQRLGLIYQREGEVGEAVRHLELGLRGTPANYLGIKVNLGQLYNALRTPQRTVSLLEPLVTQTCNVPTAHLVLGAAYLRLGDQAKAVACFDRAKALEPDVGRAQVALGIAHRVAGDLNQAMKDFEGALQSRPGWSMAQLQVAETLVAMGRTNDALAAFRAIGPEEAEGTLARNRVADLLAGGGKLDQAIEVYQGLRRSGTANLQTFDGLATALQITGDLAGAQQVLTEAIARFPDSTHARYRLGLHYALVRDYPRAITILTNALQRSPLDPRLLKALCLACARQGDLAGAIGHAESLVRLFPGDSDQRFLLASLLQDAGRRSEARQGYEEILRQSPSHIGALNNLAGLLAAQGDLAQALNLSSQAAEQAPRNASVLDTHGELLLRKGEVAQACSFLQKAAAAGPTNPTIRWHYGQALERRGDREAAINEYREAVRLSSSFPEYPEVMNRLKALGISAVP